MKEDKLELRYIPLSQARRWDENPKLHDLDALERSIETHGFGDPPKYDSTLGALVYGNGRIEVLERMRGAGRETPRGVLLTEVGEWAVPVIFGVDAESREAAMAFAVDHNHLTLLGGDLGFTDLTAIWDEEGLQGVLGQIPDAGTLLTSLDSAQVDALLQGPDFEPVPADEQSRLDEKKAIECPECGHEFAP
ncbi:MAG: hypothetical protein K0U98_05940 [Deltaproteobacteria bacterium]|nr:hypothetical protein [Deltaproteobacteria bacterium]